MFTFTHKGYAIFIIAFFALVETLHWGWLGAAASSAAITYLFGQLRFNQ